MARVPYLPVPGNIPGGVAGAPARAYDYEHIDVNPEQFGAGIGRAMQQGGRDIQEGAAALGQAAIQRQNIMNQVAADNATNEMQSRMMKILYGDPASGQKGYYGLEGRDAMDGYAPAQKALNDAYTQVRGSLQNNFQVREFDAASRRMLNYAYGDMGRKFSDASTKYATSTNMATIDLGYRAIAADPFNDTTFGNNLADIHRAIFRNAQLNGASDELRQEKLDEADAKAIGARVDAMSASNPVAAMNFLERNQTHLDGPTYGRMHKSLDTVIKGAGEDSRVNTVLGETENDYRRGTGTTQQGGYLAFFQHLEGGKPDSQTPTGKPNDPFAYGANQITLATAQRYDPTATPAKLLTPAYNDKMANTIQADLAKRYNGDLDAMAVAYNAGPGVADKWIASGRNNSTLPQQTQNYLTRAHGLVGSQGAPSGGTPMTAVLTRADYLRQQLPTMIQRARDLAEQDRPGDAEYADGVVNKLTRRVESDIKTQEGVYNADLHSVQAYILKNDVTDTAQLSNGPQPIKEAWSRLQDELPQQAKTIETKLLAPKKTAGVGPGFSATLNDIYAGKITNVAQLQSRVGTGPGEITKDGLGLATTELNAMATPQGHATATAKQTFFQWAYHRISNTDPSQGRIDPKGDAAYAKFLALALPYWNQQTAAGTSIQSLTSEKDAKSLVPMVAQFMRSGSGQTYQDFAGENQPPQIASSGYATGSPQDIGNIIGGGGEAGGGASLGSQQPLWDLSTPTGATQAYLHQKITRDQLRDIVAKNNWQPGVTATAQTNAPGGSANTTPIQGTLHLDPTIAPQVPNGAARPFAPGEWIQNPNGSWSSERTMTVQMDGKWANVPSLWIQNGKPILAKSDDDAITLAKQSGLAWRTYDSEKAANDAAVAREKAWQTMTPQDARKVAPLWIGQQASNQ